MLVYVDDLFVIGTDETRKSFMPQLSEDVLLKEAGPLVPGTEHTVRRKTLRHNGDSIDICMSQSRHNALIRSLTCMA